MKTFQRENFTGSQHGYGEGSCRAEHNRRHKPSSRKTSIVRRVHLA
jgi:hypothetical protein